jgi:3-oxoacyl-[acyl-carrier protein] reductase
MAALTGRVALVTGGSRGIGRAIAVSLADAGAAVAVNYLEKAAVAKQVADTIRDRGGKAMAVGADVSKGAAVEGMVAAVERELGPIDVLVNNAGLGLVRTLDDLTEEDFDRTIAVNLKSVFLCTQAVIPGMRARKWGRIVNISSGAARGAGGVGPHYNASKAGMEGMTRGYAARLVKDGITVNAVAPSLIETDMVRSVASSASRIPLGRFGTPEECAQVVMMLVGNEYMTGQTVALSGGLSFL